MPRARFLGVTGLGVSAFLVLLLVSVIAGCSGGEGEARRDEAAALTGGDPLRGPALMREYGCASCHAIPGVPGATASSGRRSPGSRAGPTSASSPTRLSV